MIIFLVYILTKKAIKNWRNQLLCKVEDTPINKKEGYDEVGF